MLNIARPKGYGSTHINKLTLIIKLLHFSMSHSQASSAGDPQDAGTAPADYNAWQQMTRTVAHYERLEQIGEGTYGQVYRARCKDSGRIVALKKMRIHHGGYWGMPLQLIREIKILKRLRHPNLLQMIEVVTSKGVEHLDNDDPLAKNHQVKDRVADARESYKGNLFLVLEYVEHDLTGLLDVAYQFTPVQIKCIFKQLLEALAFMHQNKYVRCYLSDSNDFFRLRMHMMYMPADRRRFILFFTLDETCFLISNFFFVFFSVLSFILT